mmetsp:Transcript_80818/g.147376  ORF Transcript_80818/g.147376 Transcript_80818/m.147376 type:complete len:124 (+) Transcript_80818:1811-2182(+)
MRDRCQLGCAAPLSAGLVSYHSRQVQPQSILLNYPHLDLAELHAGPALNSQGPSYGAAWQIESRKGGSDCQANVTVDLHKEISKLCMAFCIPLDAQTIDVIVSSQIHLPPKTRLPTTTIPDKG